MSPTGLEVSTPSQARPRLALVAVGVLVVAHAVLAVRSWYVCDDAYIAFRYVKNVVDGHGLRWNLEDPPVEGFSNPAWLALSILVRFLGFDEIAVMPAVSIVIGGATIVGVAAWIRHERPGADGAALVAAMALALSSAFVNWSTSGLETMQAAGALLLAVVAWTYEWHWFARGGLAALLVASRPEGVAWAMVCVGVGALRRPRSWSALGLAAVVAVTGAELLLLARYAIFGIWVPNTALAKSGHDASYYLRGVRYVVMNSIVQVLPIPAFLLAVWRGGAWVAQHARATAGAPFPRPFTAADVAALVLLGHMGFAAVVGGDYMPFGRFLLSGLPFAAFLLADAAAGLVGAGRVAALGALAAASLVSALPQFDVPLSTAGMRLALDFRNSGEFRPTEREMWWAERSRPIVWKEHGQYLRRLLAEDERYMVVAIGAAGYYAHRYLYDVCYLVQPIPRGTTVRTGVAAPGHDSCVMRKSPAELAATRTTASVGFTEVPERGQLGDIWSERLPTRAVRTYYRARLVDPTQKPERYFFIDRFQADDLPEEPS